LGGGLFKLFKLIRISSGGEKENSGLRTVVKRGVLGTKSLSSAGVLR